MTYKLPGLLDRDVEISSEFRTFEGHSEVIPKFSMTCLFVITRILSNLSRSKFLEKHTVL